MSYHGRRVAVLHIGTMKVGTTSIQKFLEENKRTLRERDGLSYIGPYVRLPPHLKVLIRKAGAEGKSIVICDEGWWHHRYTSQVDLAGIREVLDGYEFKVVLYVRRPDEFLQSWYLQGLKTGTGEPSFKKFLASRTVHQALALSQGVEEFETMFGPVTVRPYERSQLKDGDVISDFLRLIGVKRKGLKSITTANETPDLTALFIWRLLYEAADVSIRDSIRGILEEIPRNLMKSSSIINADEMLEIVERTKPEIDFLQARYGKWLRKSFFDAAMPVGQTASHPLRPMFDKLYPRFNGRRLPVDAGLGNIQS